VDVIQDICKLIHAIHVTIKITYCVVSIHSNVFEETEYSKLTM